MKKILLIPLMLLSMVGAVFAADTIAIDADDWVSFNDRLFATATFDNELKNATTVNWTISNGTNTFHINLNSTTGAFGANNTNVSTPMNVSGLKDILGADAFTVTVEYINASGVSLGSDTELIGIDNTLPLCSQSTLASNTVYDVTNNTFNLTMTGTNASSSTVTFGGNTVTMTKYGDNFRGSLTTLPKATYDLVTFTTTDGRNTTSCTSLTKVGFTTRGGTVGGGSLGSAVQQQTGFSLSAFAAGGAEGGEVSPRKLTNQQMAIALIVIAGGVMLVSQSGVKKKR